MALIRLVLFVLLSCFLFSTYNKNGVEGGGRRLSKEEDLELEKQLKLINKPAAKTIKTGYGDIYDCVDFYKQPAFDHPLLKNHTYHSQMRPSSVPKTINRKKEPSKANTEVLEVELKGVGCPIGTVPIRRVTKDDLIRAKLHSEKYGSKFSELTAETPGLHYAVVKTIPDPSFKFYGGGTDISTYNPSVEASQYSSARLKIENGPDSIQVGWTVNPTLYGDNRTRLFTYLTAGQSRCFNTQCPGFVIVDTEIPLGTVFDPVSRYGHVYSISFFIYKDKLNGNWWLEIGPNNTQIGFWPQRIFSGLADMATSVEYGGEVFGPPDIPSPPMGHSDYPVEEDHRYSAFCRKITVVNDAHQVVDPGYSTDQYADTYVYKAIDEGEVKDQGHLGFFGGPGGIKGN